MKNASKAIRKISTVGAIALLVGVFCLPTAWGQERPATTEKPTVELAGEEETPELTPAQQRRRRFRTTDEAKLTIGDKDVKVAYSLRLLTTGPDYPGVEAAKDGQVVVLTESAPPKLKTDLSLMFGDALVKTENVAKDYPGVYGLWLKRVGEGWHLVFNEKADAWGTMHDPASDAAEIEVEYSHDAEAAKTIAALRDDPEGKGASIKAILEADGDAGGTLRIEWGAHAWTAAFKVAS